MGTWCRRAKPIVFFLASLCYPSGSSGAAAGDMRRQEKITNGDKQLQVLHSLVSRSYSNFEEGTSTFLPFKLTLSADRTGLGNTQDRVELYQFSNGRTA
ncbi:hypothetical protein F4604DRAFT_1725397 [Suillus subluteus]|nr:hypothetical protein F4604DRAFT_1725397 [Suillus subluteus]